MKHAQRIAAVAATVAALGAFGPVTGAGAATSPPPTDGQAGAYREGWDAGVAGWQAGANAARDGWAAGAAGWQAGANAARDGWAAGAAGWRAGADAALDAWQTWVAPAQFPRSVPPRG